MGWKYVMFENTIGSTRVLFPVIFPDKLVHSDVARHVRHIQPGWDKGGVKVVSAGSIEHIEVDGLGGESETLSIKSKKGDEQVINNYSYAHGIVF